MVQWSPFLQSVYISPRDYTSWFLFYFFFLRKYYHTNEDGGVLEDPYSSQVLHTRKDGLVFGTSIHDSQREIPFRESRMWFPL